MSKRKNYWQVAIGTKEEIESGKNTWAKWGKSTEVAKAKCQESLLELARVERSKKTDYNILVRTIKVNI